MFMGFPRPWYVPLPSNVPRCQKTKAGKLNLPAGALERNIAARAAKATAG